MLVASDSTNSQWKTRMGISAYRMRLKLRAVKRDHPLIGVIQLTLNLAINAALLVSLTGVTFYLLQNIAAF